jgi:hypothetical protein
MTQPLYKAVRRQKIWDRRCGFLMQALAHPG